MNTKHRIPAARAFVLTALVVFSALTEYVRGASPGTRDISREALRDRI